MENTYITGDRKARGSSTRIIYPLNLPWLIYDLLDDTNPIGHG